MAKRQRNDFESFWPINGNGNDNGAGPPPFFPYMQAQQNHNHPFMSNTNSCPPMRRPYSTSPVQKRMRVDENGQEENQASNTNSGYVYPTSQPYPTSKNPAPAQKRTRVDENGQQENQASNTNSGYVYPMSQPYPTSKNPAPAQKRTRVDENGQQEPHADVSKFISLATDLGNAVVRRTDIDQTLALLNNIHLLITSEKDVLQCIMNGGPQETPMHDLSDRETLHWLNNFFFLQIGYLSSFKKRAVNIVEDGPWSRYASALIEGTVNVLLHLHEYNYQRHCVASKMSPGHYARANFGARDALPLVSSIQLTEAEIKECANVLCKVIRRTLDKLQYMVSKGIAPTECMSTLRTSIGILCLVQKSMYSSTPALKNDESTMDTLVRVVAEASGSVQLTTEGDVILDQTASLLKMLSARTGYDVDQSLSVLASVCADITRSCSWKFAKPMDHPSYSNPDENCAYLMSFLEKLRISLRSRDNSVQEKWHLLFRSMEVMLKTARGNTKLVKAVLTCVKYFSMSRHIVPFLSNDKQLINSIAFVATTSSGRNNSDRQHKEQSLEAMQCVTVLAS